MPLFGKGMCLVFLEDVLGYVDVFFLTVGLFVAAVGTVAAKCRGVVMITPKEGRHCFRFAFSMRAKPST